MNRMVNKAIFFAVFAALCYGAGTPLSKLLMTRLPPAFMAALLYLGAGLGMAAINLSRRLRGKRAAEAKLTSKEYPYVLAMVVLDIAAPILLMFGLSITTPADASLLNNLEIVGTAAVARIAFKEALGRRMWIAISLITTAGILLTIGDIGSLSFSPGSILVIAACLCWGIENNCTRMLSMYDPLQIVLIKGIGSGLGSLIIAFAMHEVRFHVMYVVFALLLGCFAYGLSIYFYVLAQRELGAARTSAYYAVAPFVGVGLSLIVYRQPVSAVFLAALVIMILGAYIASAEKHAHQHLHGGLEHEHRHTHNDGHHNHEHDRPAMEHSHPHVHEPLLHTHLHTPDLHHTHEH